MISFFDNLDWDMVWEATGSTVYMTAIAGFSTFVLGLIIGLLLYATNEELLFKNRAFYSVLSLIVNVFRSIPFIILLILLIPFTTAIVGSFLGPTAALPALILGAAPFYGRMVELALREVDKGVIGGGGLGDMAFIEGFQRSQNDVIVIATLLILAIVFVIQIIGDLLIRAIDKR